MGLLSFFAYIACIFGCCCCVNKCMEEEQNDNDYDYTNYSSNQALINSENSSSSLPKYDDIYNNST